MKRKGDFVTNSSSCSFVLLGWQLDKSQYENAEDFDKYGMYIGYGDEGGAVSDDYILVGEMIVDHDEYNEAETTITTMNDILKSEDLKKVKEDFGLGDPCFITGVRLC